MEIKCENCRFKFEHENYIGLRCARHAPVSTNFDTGFTDEVWVGVRVSRQFYCAEGEWWRDGEWKELVDVT